MTKVHIIGAGLAGLLAANMIRNSIIFEKQSSLPNNHSSLLRFKTGLFGTAIGIPFKEVNMIKGVHGDNSNPIKNMIQYSQKVTGQARTDRSLLQGFIQEKRYIAPRDLIARMSDGLEIKYSNVLIFDEKMINAPVISTIPMPSLMEILNYPYRKDVNFKHRSGVNVIATIENCDAYATFYYPILNDSAYRASVTGDQLIIEFVIADEEKDDPIEVDPIYLAHYYADHFGFAASMISDAKVKEQAYAKILPIDEEIRRDFMHWATDRHNIYSLGRYATWRPSLLLDDLVKDVSLISNWISKGGKYGAARHR